MTLIKRTRRWAKSARLGFVLLGAGLLSSCGKEPQTNVERPPAPVTVAKAVSQDVPRYIDAVGKMVAREVVSIQPQVSGRITKIHFTDGAELKIGDVLFTIDPRPFQAQLNQAEAQSRASRSDLKSRQGELHASRQRQRSARGGAARLRR